MTTSRSSSSKLSSDNTKRRYHVVQKVFIFHFYLGFIVLLIGISRNGGRKYIRANPEQMNLHEKCDMVYVNVLSTNQFDSDNYICCNESNSNASATSWWTNFSSHEHGLCSQKMRSLPWVKSLTRFPDSWILPIIPLLVRIGIALLSKLIGMRSTTSGKDSSVKQSSMFHATKLSTSMKRLFFYFCIMLFRGFVLYDFANNFIGRKLLLSRFPMTATGSIITGTQECWYTKFVPIKTKSIHRDFCIGQQFDFSDHIVLFFAHHYSILIMEILFCALYPFWPLKISNHRGEPNENSVKGKKSSTSTPVIHSNAILPTCFLFLFGYMTIIILFSVYSTATYYHTVLESCVGYILSLFIQIPIGMMIMSNSFIGLSNGQDHYD